MVYNGASAGEQPTPDKFSRLQYTGGGYYFGWSVGIASNPTDNQATSVSNTKAGNIVTTVWTAGSTRVTQTVTYQDGDDFVRYNWAVQNTTGSALADLRFFHGMDSCLGATDEYCDPMADTGAGIWIESAKAVGARNVSGGTEKRFYLQGITPPYAYESSEYLNPVVHMSEGALPSTLDEDPATDNGYALEWRTGSLAPGAVWSVDALERFSVGTFDSVTVAAPPPTEIDRGTSGDLNYILTNDELAAVDVDLSVFKDQPTWDAALQGAATRSVPGDSSITVTVRVTVPAGAAIGATGLVTLTTDGPNPGVSSDKASVLVTGAVVPEYTLTVNTVGNGSVSKNPDQATYTAGSVVTLTAVPSATYAFARWTGDETGTTNPLAVTMSANKTVTATFLSRTADEDGDGISNATELDGGTDPFDGTDNDSVAEQVATIVAASDDPADGAPTVGDLTNPTLGLLRVITGNMPLYEEAIANAVPAPTTKAELQAIIDGVNRATDSDGDGICDATELDGGTDPADPDDNDTVEEKVTTIAAASDVPADGAPTVQDLINTGLTGVITGNLAAYEAGFVDPTALGLPALSSPPTQAELQAVIDAVNGADKYTLTVVTAGSGVGMVTRVPSMTNYVSGTLVRLLATAAASLTQSTCRQGVPSCTSPSAP